MREGHEPVRPVPPRGEGAVSAVWGEEGGVWCGTGGGREGGGGGRADLAGPGLRNVRASTRIESTRVESLEGCPNTQHMHKRFRDEQVVDVD